MSSNFGNSMLLKLCLVINDHVFSYKLKSKVLISILNVSIVESNCRRV